MTTMKLFLPLCLSALFQSAYAFPTMAGGCAGGVAAVNGQHLDDTNGRVVTTGPLAEGNFQVSIGSTILDPTVPAEIGVDELHTVSLGTTTSDAVFKGFLFRFEGLEGDFVAQPASSGDAQFAAVCTPPIAGVTHTSADDKVTASSTFLPSSTGPVALDVTVVVSNKEESIYYYTGYSINVVEGTDQSNATMTPGPISSAAPTPTLGPSTVVGPTVTPRPTVPGAMTFPPTATFEPTVTAAPTYSEPCYVCGGPDTGVTLPGATITLNGLRVTCGEVEENGLANAIPPEFCPFVQEPVAQNCGCMELEVAPTVTPAPTPNATLMPTVVQTSNVSDTPTFVDMNETLVPTMNVSDLSSDVPTTMDVNDTVVPTMAPTNATGMPTMMVGNVSPAPTTAPTNASDMPTLSPVEPPTASPTEPPTSGATLRRSLVWLGLVVVANLF